MSLWLLFEGKSGKTVSNRFDVQYKIDSDILKGKNEGQRFVGRYMTASLVGIDENFCAGKRVLVQIN